MPNKQQKVILRTTVANLGHKGDVVTVATGYARNFLIPQGQAFAWTAGAEKQIEAMRKARRAQVLATREDAVALKEQLEGSTVEISAKVSESGKLFGGISADAIASALAAKQISVDPKTLVFEPIRTTGDFPVTANVHPEISAQFTVKVTAEK
jgi:large subunit ribosomal protein L9